MKIKIFTIISLLCTLVVSAQTNSEVEAFAKELAAKSSSVNTIVCDFTETRHMDVLTSEVVRGGCFSYKRPERIALAFESGDRIVMTPTNFAMVNEGRRLSSKISSNPMLRQMQAIFSACMTGDVEQLVGGGKVVITTNAKSHTLQFTPAARSAQKYVRQIVLLFDRATMTLSELRMEQPSGDYTHYRFGKKVLNGEVDDSNFQL